MGTHFSHSAEKISIRQRIDRFCNLFLVLCVSAASLFMTVMSFLFTQRCGREIRGEIENGVPIYQIWDNPLFHVAGIFLLFAAFIGIFRLREKIRKKALIFSQIGIALTAGLFSCLILLGGVRTPINDQVQVYSAASLFNQGNYINLTRGGYLNMYPQQLGFVAYLQVLFHIFGNENFIAVQAINCIWIAGLVFMLCQILNELTGDNAVRLAGSLSFLFLLPLFLLSSWVYGDVPSFFFLALAFLQYLRYLKDEKKQRLLFMALFMGASLLFRKNSLIALLALCIALSFHGLRRRQPAILAAVLLILLLPLGALKVVESYYQAAGNYEIDGGLPASLWISMGMSEDSSNPGWFSNYCVPLYYSVDCDRSAASRIAAQDIHARLSLFLEDPVYGISFYKRKICTQWNDPFYNTNFLIATDGESRGITNCLLALEDGFLLTFLSVLQFLNYFGLFVYCIRVADKKHTGENALLIFFLGGVLFSILWEANSRYIYSYILLSMPLSTIGWADCINNFRSLRPPIHNASDT